MTDSTPAGWHQDPHGPGQRYWDGHAWTEHVQPAPPPPSNQKRVLIVAGAVVLMVLLAAVVVVAVSMGGDGGSPDGQEDGSEGSDGATAAGGDELVSFIRTADGRPTAVAATGPDAWISEGDAGTLSHYTVIDGDDGPDATREKVDVGGEVTDVAVGGDVVWAELGYDQALVPIPVDATAPGERISVADGALAATPSGVWSLSTLSELTRVDGATGEAADPVQLPDSSSLVAVDGEAAVIVSISGDVSVVDAATLEVTSVGSLGTDIFGDAAVIDGVLWFLDGSTVAALALATGERSEPFEREATRLASDGENLWVFEGRTVAELDPETGTVIAELELGPNSTSGSPRGEARDFAAGDGAWVLRADDGEVDIVAVAG